MPTQTDSKYTLSALSTLLGRTTDDESKQRGTVAARLGFLGLLETCSRCGGSGKYSFNLTDGDKCFKCRGAGKTLPKLTAKLFKAVEARVAAGDLVPYLEARKASLALSKEFKPLIAAAEPLVTRGGKVYEWALNWGGEKRVEAHVWEEIYRIWVECSELYYMSNTKGFNISRVKDALQDGKVVGEGVEFTHAFLKYAVSEIEGLVMELEALKACFEGGK